MTASRTWTKATDYRPHESKDGVFWVDFDDGESVSVTDEYMSCFGMQALVAGEARRRELEDGEAAGSAMSIDGKMNPLARFWFNFQLMRAFGRQYGYGWVSALARTVLVTFQRPSRMAMWKSGQSAERDR